MKLHYSATSPYVRKVLVAAMECGLENQIERVTSDAWDPNTPLVKDNPLGKVPALVTDNGQVLCESPVICDYLNSLSKSGAIIPGEGEARWKSLNLAALAQGITDAAIQRIIELRQRPDELRWDGWLERQKGKISAALDRIEQMVQAGDLEGVDIGTITLGCALGYLDFRFGDDRWRDGRPGLAAWYESFAERPSMQATQPPT